MLVACGGDDDESGNDTDADVRAAVAEYFYAAADNDPDAVCDSLTDEGRRQAVTDAIRLEILTKVTANCEEAVAEAFRSYGDQREAIAEGDRKLADRVESGEIEGNPVKVVLDGDSATVTFKAGATAFRVLVERVGGDWRVADPSPNASPRSASDK
jgi:hypothetical protein